MKLLPPLKVEGEGTSDIESLASYFSRMATLLRISTYQLAVLLTDKTGVRSFGKKETPYFGGRNAMLINGFGGQAKCVVSWINTGHKRGGAEAMTLLSLQHVLPKLGPSALKANRAWCPACMAEARSSGRACYEKLTWFIRAITRCPHHNIDLEENCPACDSLQRTYSTIGGISSCSVCCADLVSSPKYWNHRSRPAYGEREILEVIEYSAANPGFIYMEGGPQIFARAYSNRFVRKDKDNLVRRLGADRFRNLFYAKRRLIFDSVVDLSLATEVSMNQMLLDPTEAAKIARLDPNFSVMRSPAKRKLRVVEDKNELGSRLFAALDDAAAESPLALKQICRTYGVSADYAHYWFPETASLLIERRIQWLNEMRENVIRTAEQAVRTEGIPKYLARQWTSHDDVVANLAAEHTVSKRILRAELSRQLSLMRQNII